MGRDEIHFPELFPRHPAHFPVSHGLHTAAGAFGSPQNRGGRPPLSGAVGRLCEYPVDRRSSWNRGRPVGVCPSTLTPRDFCPIFVRFYGERGGGSRTRFVLRGRWLRAPGCAAHPALPPPTQPGLPRRGCYVHATRPKGPKEQQNAAAVQTVHETEPNSFVAMSNQAKPTFLHIGPLKIRRELYGGYRTTDNGAKVEVYVGIESPYTVRYTDPKEVEQIKDDHKHYHSKNLL